MNIYHSEKVLPYVYICTHKETSQFYIGSRYGKRQKFPSTKDIFTYKTSSLFVRDNFEFFDVVIIAEFFAKEDAYDFEQQLISENWGNNLLINKSCFYGKSRFNGCGMKTEESINKWRASRKNKSSEDEKLFKEKMSKIVTDYHKNLTIHEKQIRSKKISEIQKNRSDADKKEISDKLSKIAKEQIRQRSVEEWEEIKKKKQSTFAKRKALGIPNKTAIKIDCPQCRLSISASNYSRHMKSRHSF